MRLLSLYTCNFITNDVPQSSHHNIVSWQSAELSVLSPTYASPELHATLQQRRGLEHILRSNDVWMMAHVLLVLGFRSSMPRHPEGGFLYPCQSDVTSSSGGFRGYLEAAEAGHLRKRLLVPENRDLRSLLFFMYAAPQDRLTAQQVTLDLHATAPIDICQSAAEKEEGRRGGERKKRCRDIAVSRRHRMPTPVTERLLVSGRSWSLRALHVIIPRD
jgi:hypothetical protein